MSEMKQTFILLQIHKAIVFFFIEFPDHYSFTRASGEC